jgi:hypothetical protein
MRDSVRTLLGLFAAIILTLCVTSDASAQAVQFRINGLCELPSEDTAEPVPNTVTGLGYTIVGGIGHQVITPSGNIQLICQFSAIPAGQDPPANTIVNRGFLCDVFAGPDSNEPLYTTSDTQCIVTKSGQATLTCKIHPVPPAE